MVVNRLTDTFIFLDFRSPVQQCLPPPLKIFLPAKLRLQKVCKIYKCINASLLNTFRQLINKTGNFFVMFLRKLSKKFLLPRAKKQLKFYLRIV